MGNVLIVEDDADKAATVSKMCRRAGHFPLWCSDVQDARDSLKDAAERGIELKAVVTDWNMPLQKDYPVHPHAGQVVIDAVRELIKEQIPIFVFSGELGQREGGPGVTWFQAPRDVEALYKRLQILDAPKIPPLAQEMEVEADRLYALATMTLKVPDLVGALEASRELHKSAMLSRANLRRELDAMSSELATRNKELCDIASALVQYTITDERKAAGTALEMAKLLIQRVNQNKA